jgi:glucosamine-6-phosphate deaminase
MSRKAANVLSAQVILKPDSVLGLSTGFSPIGTYRQLVEWYKKGDLDFSSVITVNLDEYCGLVPGASQSYRCFMNENLFDHVNVKRENIHIPNGMELDAERECARYETLIERLSGINMQLLGIGHNGHIGFNEPGTAFETSTRRVALSESTIAANKRFFKNERDVPRYAYTMGIRSIMQAAHILLIVSGGDKAQIVKEAFTGAVTPAVPASVLQLHNNVTLVGDGDALSLLSG